MPHTSPVPTSPTLAPTAPGVTSPARRRRPAPLAVGLAAGVALALAGCAATASAGGSTPAVGTTQEGGRTTYGTPFTYADGLTVQVDAPARFTPTPRAEWERGAKDVVVRLTITVTNGSPAAYSPDTFSATAVSGGLEAAPVVDSASRIELTGPDVTAEPAQDVSFPLAFAVPDPDDVTVTVDPALGGYGALVVSAAEDAGPDAS